ncbi:GntR family transcriptional regulator [Komarekiella sp. 'clone 1']|uniref:GntR family transcriptional regulator n=1 Tax=Komarekiella delphini-convector SJRDD-AB1 TaxID=2593771 RepID=A0AA40T5E8_9NOST|nr:GntR family transcriptional regulator [Komarekiella delphini-convector]MBD6620934.1 GntR family transcriptional regulator [Komarekiella delphini-convector SJRDD-AB1]
MPHSILFTISIEIQAAIKINTQIVEQIKLLISSGYLQPGDTLPTITQLAQHLKVNHNTVAAVYNHLIKSGYLVAKKGKGTFVAYTKVTQNILHQEVYNLLHQSFNAAKRLGLSPSEFSTAAYTQAAMLNQHTSSPLELVFIENSSLGTDIYEVIQSEIKLSLSFLSLKDFKTNQSKLLKKILAADLIITTVQHQWEVSKLTASQQEVIAISLKPDLQLLTKISSLSRHALMLLICQEEADCQMMKQVLQQSGISHINFQTLPLKHLQQDDHLLKKADAVCTSRLAESYVRQYSFLSSEVMLFNFRLDPTNMSVLKNRIAAIKFNKLATSDANK